jgi:ribonuclease-3
VAAQKELGGETLERLKDVKLAMERAQQNARKTDSSLLTDYFNPLAQNQNQQNPFYDYSHNPLLPHNQQQPHQHQHPHQEQVQQLQQLLPQVPPLTDEMREIVFTHRSAADNKLVRETGSVDTISYEKLEWYGDAYISLLASRILWNRYPHLPVGRANKIREMMTTNDVLGKFAVRHGFDKQLRLSDAMRRQMNPKTMHKMLGDIWEAYIAGAILSDPLHGFANIEYFMQLMWEPFLIQTKLDPIDPSAKQRLAIMVTWKNCKLDYVETRPKIDHRESGTATYFQACYFTGYDKYDRVKLGEGQAGNRQEATVRAAMDALNTNLVQEIAAEKKARLQMGKSANAGGHIG